MAIAKTAAFYRPGGQGGEEQTINRAWLSQVFDERVVEHLPRIKLISWFEWRNNEAEVTHALGLN
jgi:hypothetical protein